MRDRDVSMPVPLPSRAVSASAAPLTAFPPAAAVRLLLAEAGKGLAIEAGQMPGLSRSQVRRAPVRRASDTLFIGRSCSLAGPETLTSAGEPVEIATSGTPYINIWSRHRRSLWRLEAADTQEARCSVVCYARVSCCDSDHSRGFAETSSRSRRASVRFGGFH